MKRPMRHYRPDVVRCRACGRPVTGEVRMVGRDVWHPLCWRPAFDPAITESELRLLDGNR